MILSPPPIGISNVISLLSLLYLSYDTMETLMSLEARVSQPPPDDPRSVSSNVTTPFLVLPIKYSCDF